MTKKKLIKEADLNTRTGKYFLARKKGLNKKEAQVVAGFRGGNHSTQIERSDTFQALKTKYKDVLQEKITLSEIADEHVKVIKQDQELGPKNKAIEMAYSKIEEDGSGSEEKDVMVVVLQAK